MPPNHLPPRDNQHDPHNDGDGAADLDAVSDWKSLIIEAARGDVLLDVTEPLAFHRDSLSASVASLQREIPAAAIRGALTEAGLEPGPMGLRLRGAIVIDCIELSFAEIPCSVSLFECDLVGGVRIANAAIAGGLYLQGGTVGAEGDTAIDMRSVRTNADVTISGCTVTGAVRASGARVRGSWEMGGTKVTAKRGDALNLEGAEIGMGLFLDEGFSSTGTVRARGAQIAGQVNFIGASLACNGGMALSLEGADIRGDAWLQKDFVASGEVSLLGATISGTLEMDGAVLRNEGGTALGLGNVQIAGAAHLGGLTAVGGIDALGASFGSQFVMTAAEIENVAGDALNLDNAHISGNVALNEGFRTRGEVRAMGSRIAGQLNMSAAILQNEGGDALTLDGAQVDEGAFLDSGFTVTGEVRAMNCVMGMLSMTGATITNGTGDALTLNGTHVLGGVYLDDGFSAIGQVRARRARFDGLLAMDGGEFWNQGGEAIDLSRAQVSELLMSNMRGRGSVNLTSAEIGALSIEDEDCSGVLGRVWSRSGWKIQDIHGPLRTNRALAHEWLLRTAEQEGWTPQPWVSVAAVYDRNGQPHDGRWIRWRAARQTTRNTPWRTAFGFSRLVRYAYGALTGHGYYPLVAGVWLLILYVGTTLLVYGPARGNLVPAGPDAAVLSHVAVGPAGSRALVTGKTPCSTIIRLSPAHPCLDPPLYALDIVLPAGSALGQTSSWRPANASPSRSIPWYAFWRRTAWTGYTLTLLRAASWAMAAILLAALTGLLRKTG